MNAEFQVLRLGRIHLGLHFADYYVDGASRKNFLLN